MSENKKFILNADDFGMSSAYSKAVLEGCREGILRSVSIVSNGKVFEDAVERIVPLCEGLGIGVHLNITEGKALSADLNKLTNENGIFNNNFLQLLIKAYSPKNADFMAQLEQEFRAQIKRVKDKGITITHIDSHVHVHAIPPIFELVCKLAKEFGIRHIRVQKEKPYIIPDIQIHLNWKYLGNLFNLLLMNFFSKKNYSVAEKYELRTNDYLIGIAYHSMMTGMSVAYGLSTIPDKDNIIVEAMIHPCRYEDGKIDNYFAEYKITKNQKLKARIEKLGFEITNFDYEDEEED